MSLKDDLYALFKKAESLEVHEAFRKTEYRTAAAQRDRLLALCWEAGIAGPDAECRHCGAPMSLMPWDRQYCSHCRDE